MIDDDSCYTDVYYYYFCLHKMYTDLCPNCGFHSNCGLRLFSLRTLLGWWSRFQLLGISGFWEGRWVTVCERLRSCNKRGGKSVNSWLWSRIVVHVFAQITVRAGCKLSLHKWTCPYSTKGEALQNLLNLSTWSMVFFAHVGKTQNMSKW